MSSSDICSFCGKQLGMTQYSVDGKWSCLECKQSPPKIITPSGLLQQTIQQIGGGQHIGEFTQTQQTVDDLCQNVIGIQADLVGFREHIHNLQEIMADLNAKQEKYLVELNKMALVEDVAKFQKKIVAKIKKLEK